MSYKRGQKMVRGDYAYKVDRSSNNKKIIRFSCVKALCRGRGVYDIEKDQFKKTQDHVCARNRHLKDTEDLKIFLKEASQSNVSTCQEHLENYQAEHPDVLSNVDLNTHQLGQIYSEQRASVNPRSKLKNVNNLDEMADVLLSNPEELRYTANLQNYINDRSMECHKVRENGNTHLILYDTDFVKQNSFAERWFVDATFSSRPRKIGYQLLTIMCEKMGKAVPVIYVLMDSKKELSYNAVFKEIKVLFPYLQVPKEILVDYEKGLHNALKKNFGKARIVGCYFHFTKAAYKQARKKGAAKLKNKSKQPDRHHMLKKFLALPLLPPSLIEEAFEFLEVQCYSEHGTYFNEYIHYFRKEWINKWKEGGISVYGLIHITNNFIESHHSKMRIRFGKRPSPKKFIRQLKKQQILAWSDFNKLKRGVTPTAPEKKELKQKRAIISDILKSLEQEVGEDKDFGKILDALAHTIGYDDVLDDIAQDLFHDIDSEGEFVTDDEEELAETMELN